MMFASALPGRREVLGCRSEGCIKLHPSYPESPAFCEPLNCHRLNVPLCTDHRRAYLAYQDSLHGPLASESRDFSFRNKYLSPQTTKTIMNIRQFVNNDYASVVWVQNDVRYTYTWNKRCGLLFYTNIL